MQELEKILEEIEKHKYIVEIFGRGVFFVPLEVAKDIIRKHMNDGWIPVEEEIPTLGQRLQATILHHEWVSDYDSSWVPPEEKIHHPAYTEVCEIYSVGAMWYYACAEDDYHRDVAYINPLKDLSSPVAEIIAWRPLPEPHRPERRTQDEAKNREAI